MTREKIPPGFQPGWLPCLGCGKVHPIPTIETMQAFERAHGRVPWGKDSEGKPVYTNGIKEDLLGLSPFIRGWSGEEGYYVADEHDAAVTSQIIASIDWDRVKRIDAMFDLPFNVGDTPGMMFGEQLLVDPGTYERLHHACFKSVAQQAFDDLIAEVLTLPRVRRKTHEELIAPMASIDEIADTIISICKGLTVLSIDRPGLVEALTSDLSERRELPSSYEVEGIIVGLEEGFDDDDLQELPEMFKETIAFLMKTFEMEDPG